ncbi:IS1 family transposase, partial [Acinetobacter gandensis]
MKTQIQINCPDCHSPSLKKNGKKSYGKQNYQCKDCKRQFIGDHALTYNGCHSRI